MKELNVESLTKSYGEKTLFHNISFHIREKDRIGLIGVNGTGKTSLLNSLFQSDVGDVQSIQVPSQYQIGYLSQDQQLPKEQTVIEAIFQGNSPIIKAVKNYELALLALSQDGENKQVQQQYALAEEEMNKQDAWSADTQAKIILQKLGITDLDKKIGFFSGGQQKRICLAQILIESPDLLLLDEPTNHLDYEAIQWLESYLANYQGAVMMVTHDRYFLDQVTNRIFELSFGQLYEYKGNYQTYLSEKAERQRIEQTQEEKRKQLYKQELAWMRAGVQARGTKQQARQDRFHDLEKNLHHVQQQEEITIDLATQRIGKKVIDIQDGVYKINQKTLFHDFNLLVQAKDRIGITGKNGSGKSTLLNILAGRINLTSGIYSIGETVKIAYYTQTNEEMSPEKRMITYLQEAAEEAKQADGTTISVTELLEQFLFPRSTHGTLIGKLSGGEKRRLYLLKLLISQPNVLLLDEPTNDLDTDTLTVLEDYIQKFKGAVIAVSHDRYFLDKTMTKLLNFEDHGVITSYFGTMSEYLECKKQQLKEQEDTVKTQPKRELKEKTKEKTKLTYMEQKEWETIEDEISELEEQCTLLITEMNQQGDNFSQLQELQTRLNQTQELLDNKMVRWEYLSTYVQH